MVLQENAYYQYPDILCSSASNQVRNGYFKSKESQNGRFNGFNIAHHLEGLI